MNGFSQRLFDGLAAVSLALFVALVADVAIVHQRQPHFSLHSPVVTTTFEKGVWVFNYHAVATGTRFIDVLGWRVPVIPAVILTIAFPLFWVVIRPRQSEVKQDSPGFCRNCGCDLRATPDRCPQCGTIPRKVE